MHSVAAVPHSRFAVKPKANYSHYNVMTVAIEAVLGVGPDAGVRTVRLVSPSRVEVTRLDGTTFTVWITTTETTDGNPAELVVSGPDTVQVRLSGRAGRGIVERTMANAVAQASALLSGAQTTDNLLDNNSHPGDQVQLSPADQGRVAEIRNLDRVRAETARFRILRRRRISAEIKALVEQMGLHPDDPVAPQRQAVVSETSDTIARHVRSGDRRPDWALPPTGYPKWKAFLVYHLPAEVLPGVAAGTTIAITGNGIVGLGVGVAAAVSGVSGTIIKRWYGRREKTNVDGGHGVLGKVRADEAATRRRQLFDPLLARVRTGAPATPPPAPPTRTMPPTHQPMMARIVGRGGGPALGAAAATLVMFAGLPFWNAASHIGVALGAAVIGTVAEKYFRHRMVKREWAMLDNVGREKDVVAAEFDQRFAEQLSALLDRIDNLTGANPTPQSPTADPVRIQDVDRAGWLTYGGNQAAGQSGDIARSGADAMSKMMENLAGGSNAMGTGGMRATLGTLLNALYDRRFIANEYKEIVEQVHHDFGNKMAEQVALEQRVLDTVLADLTARVDAAEAAINRVNATLASRVNDLRAATPPVPTPADPANRPRGHQRWQAFRNLHLKQAVTMSGLMASASAIFSQSPTGVIVIGSVSAAIAANFGLRYLFRRSEQVAVDETIFADRAKERPVEEAEARARMKFLSELVNRAIDAAVTGRTTPNGPPAAPAVPTFPRRTDPAYPDQIDAHIAHERELMFHEARPWPVIGPQLVGLERLERLTQRVRDFDAHARTTGDAAPSQQARKDLRKLWEAYNTLKNDGTPMPTDYELLANEKPEGLRGGPPGTELPGRLQSYLDDSLVTPAGRAYYAPGDELRAEAHLVPVEPGQYTIDMHGGPDFVRVGNVRLTPTDLAVLVAADPNWSGQPIRLLACDTGSQPDGFAQQLADLLGVTVYAPTASVGLDPDGVLFVTETEADWAGIVRPVLPPTGRLYEFTPTVTAEAEQAADPDTAPTSAQTSDPPTEPPSTPTAEPGTEPAGAPLPQLQPGLWWPDHQDVEFGAVRAPAPIEDLGELTLLRDGPTVYTGTERLWPDELADLVTGSDDWRGGPARLQIRDGHVDPDFVQRLADLLGAPVLVMAEAVAGEFPALSSGTLEVYNEPAPVRRPPGDWRIYEPRTIPAGKGTP